MPDTSPHSPLAKRLIIIALVICALAASPFIHRKVKQHRAADLADKSIGLALEGHPEQARESADAAFNLAPGSPKSLRAKARSAGSPTDAFFFGHALLRTGSATSADILHYLETCLALDFDAELDQVLRPLLESEPEVIDNWLIAGRIELRRGRAQLALECAGRALELDPQNRLSRLLTAEIAGTSSEKQFREAAVSTLEKLIAENPEDPVSLSAQIALLPKSADALLAHPLADASQQLLAAQNKLGQAPGATSRQEIIEATIARHRERQLPALLHWLTSNQLPQRSLALVDYDQARASSPLFTAWCHAMIAAGNAGELVKLVEDPNRYSQMPLPANARQLVLVDAYETLARKSIADVHWNKLLRAALIGDSKSKLLPLAQWAERHGFDDRAISIYETLLTKSPEETPVWYDRIAALARRSNQLPRLRELSERLLVSTPQNIVYQHNFAYLCALAGKDLEIASEILTDLIEKSPQAGSARCALALIKKQEGNEPAASAQLEMIDPASLDPAASYIYLKLSGKPAIAPAEFTQYELDALERAAASHRQAEAGQGQ